MANSSKQETPKQKEETRKQTIQRRKDLEVRRRLWIGLGIVGVILVGLLGAALIQELVIKPRTPVAVVNNTRIATDEYAKRVRFNWLQNQQVDPQSSSLEVLDQMVDEVLVREQAQQRGLTVTEDEITERIEQFFGYQRVPPTPASTPTPDPAFTPGPDPTATPFPTSTPVSLESYQTAYQDYLKVLKDRAGFTEADFRSLVGLDLLRQKLFDDVTKDTPATEEQVHARHILIRTIDPQPTPEPVEGQPTPTPGPEPRTADQALALAIELKQRLDAGEDFATLAAEYSEDTGSAANGGELGWFGRGMMVAEFEEAVFALAPGEVSSPVQTAFGYHLIKVDEKDPARPSDPFTLQQRQAETFDTWLTDLRNAASIQRNWSLDVVPPTPSPLGG